MTTDPAFRLSTYLALALACAALGAAEFAILPEVGAFAALAVVALVVLYRLEKRADLLSLAAANNVGIGIALATVGWAAVRVVREVRVGEFATVGWGVFFVLLFAPILMAAVVAKLLRREKDVGDYWYLHAAGLAAVVLAAAIARRPWEVALLAAYGAAAVWALSRFALARGNAAPVAGRRAGVGGAARWVAAAVAVAAPAFFLTPASPFEKWDFSPGRIEVGFTSDQAIDLNRTGELAAGAAVAFEVTAEADGKPKDDLDPDTRWRGRILSHYAQGAWRREATVRLPQVNLGDLAARADPWTPPALGPGSYQLRYSVPLELRSDFLAEPVVWAPRRPPPVADVFAPPTPPRGWYPLTDGSFLRSPGRPDRSPNLMYVQHVAPPPAADLGTGFLLVERGDSVLTANPVPAVRAFTTKLLARLVAEGKLPPAAAAANAVSLRPPDDRHEAVARAFAGYLSGPEFTYTTTLTRSRADLDPVQDFLEHTKAGHCERYASALVLMLRSQGIPAVLALGFKGHEPVGDGRYLVRQDRAHAWALALVSRPDTGSGQVWHWLSLDPSPAAETAAGAAGTASKGGWAWVWDRLFDATPEERLGALGELAARPIVAWVAGGLVVTGVLGWVAWRARRRRAAQPAASPWLDPLRAALAPHGLTPDAGETPHEFAARAAAALAARPATAGVAHVPPAWVGAYYAQRFGGAAPSPERRAELDTALLALRTAPAVDAHR